jgi:hypothetical protein
MADLRGTGKALGLLGIAYLAAYTALVGATTMGAWLTLGAIALVVAGAGLRAASHRPERRRVAARLERIRRRSWRPVPARDVTHPGPVDPASAASMRHAPTDARRDRQVL